MKDALATIGGVVVTTFFVILVCAAVLEKEGPQKPVAGPLFKTMSEEQNNSAGPHRVYLSQVKGHEYIVFLGSSGVCALHSLSCSCLNTNH